MHAVTSYRDEVVGNLVFFYIGQTVDMKVKIPHFICDLTYSLLFLLFFLSKIVFLNIKIFKVMF